MANYNYDEGGNMSAYFLITFLALVLIPVSISAIPSKQRAVKGCQCEQCAEQRKKVEKLEKGTLFRPKLSKKSMVLTVGWSLFLFLCYKVAGAKVENKVYDPFEVLGLRAGISMKEIKSHFKQLSRTIHPDKVTPSVNNTIEMIQDRFIQVTKAYKSLTDETIRKNWELYGHPDGRQETTMGLALPAWIVASQNNIWVLGFYGLLFGAGLPALVGNWWFGSRHRTKDGVHAQSAALFFKTLREDSGMEDIVSVLSSVYQWEHPVSSKAQPALEKALDEVEADIKNIAGRRWDAMMELTSAQDLGKRRALILLFAYFLRIPINSVALQKEQIDLLRQAPVLLSALLNVASSRSWIIPTLSAMRLHAYFAQALPPAAGTGESRMRFIQLPGIKASEIALDGQLAPDAKDFDEFVLALEKAQDGRVNEVKKVVKSWGRLDIVDTSFKVIGERAVTPMSYVFLVVKLRILPPLVKSQPKVELSKEATKRNDEKDYKFLAGKSESEEVVDDTKIAGYAHTPFWPGNRKPSWWIVITDEKNNRIVVPPMKITDLPISSGSSDNDRDYRSYKIQFQAPQQTGFLTWKMILISDTYVGEELSQNLVVKIEDPSTLEELADDDYISDPDEDSLAGQMALMRGGKVKDINGPEESDDESGTDDDESSAESDSSDDD